MRLVPCERSIPRAPSATHARHAIASIAFALVLGVASTSAAAPREAQERFEEGRALVKAGRPADAIPKFLASIAAEPTTSAVLNLADCYERVGKLASAHARFRQAQEMSKESDAVRSNEARKRAEMLEPRLSTITLLPPANARNMSVWVDGEPVASSEWGKPRPYDPGRHEVVVQDASGRRRTSVVEVGGEGVRVTAPIDPGEPTSTGGGAGAAGAGGAGNARGAGANGANGANGASGTSPDGRDIGPAPPPSGSTTKTVGIVIGAAGIVSLGVGFVTGAVALGAASDLKDQCPSYPRCPSDQRSALVDLDDRASTMGTVSTVTIIAGSVLVVTGALLWLTSKDADTPRQGRLPPRWAAPALGGLVF